MNIPQAIKSPTPLASVPPSDLLRSLSRLISMALMLGLCLGCHRPSDPSGQTDLLFQLDSNSMAPSLWGPTLTGSCPKCDQNWMIAQETFRADIPLICPSCGWVGQITGKSPGQRVRANLLLPDQPIDRWQCVIFRDQELSEGQAMSSGQTRLQVKRVLGLPEEQLAFRDGELWINNHKMKKTMDQMRLVAVPVSTFPNDARCDWYQTSKGSAGKDAIAIEPLSLNNERFKNPAAASDPQVSQSSRKLFLQNEPLRLRGPSRIEWRHRNWLDVEKHLRTPSEGDTPHRLEGIKSSSHPRELSVGAEETMGARQADASPRQNSSAVLDDYWMNHSTALNLVPVHDLLLTIQFSTNTSQTTQNYLSDSQVAPKATVLQLQCIYLGRLHAVDFQQSDLAPISVQPLGPGQSRLECSDKTLQTVSIGGWDGSVWLQCNGHPPIEIQPVSDSGTTTTIDDAVTTFAIELSSGSVNIDQMTIFRDLYLRVDQRDVQNGLLAPVTLAKNQFYVVGDNLPISIDSRNDLGLVERSQIRAVVVSTDQPNCEAR